MKKHLMAMFLILACLTPCFIINSLAVNTQFPTVNSYVEGQYRDVKKTDWYVSNVAKVYELGLMKGSSSATFNTNGTLTIAETIAMAARIHSIYTTGTESFSQGSPWYQTYVDYAIQNKIITSTYQNYDRAVGRAEFAVILYNSIPESALTPINNIPDGTIPDVPSNQSYTNAVYKLYRAGILTGNDKYGTFSPNSYINRSSAAAIISRIPDKTLRVPLNLVHQITIGDLQGKWRNVLNDRFYYETVISGTNLICGCFSADGSRISYSTGTFSLSDSLMTYNYTYYMSNGESIVGSCTYEVDKNASDNSLILKNYVLTSGESTGSGFGGTYYNINSSDSTLINADLSSETISQDVLGYYLKRNFGTLHTCLGDYRCIFTIIENDKLENAYDYRIEVDSGAISDAILNIMPSFKYTKEQKEQFIQDLRSHMEKIGSSVVSKWPEKKFEGCYFSSGYKYYYLKMGYHSSRYFFWNNYDDELGTGAMYRKYNSTKPSTFRFDEWADNKIEVPED